MNAVIQVEHLNKSFQDFKAVKDLSFSVHSGEIFGIIGPNGAGKTTTIEIIEGLQTPTSGRVEVLGLNPSEDIMKVREQIGIMFQHTNLQNKIRVFEAIELFCSFYPKQISAEEALRHLNLEEHRNTYFKNLSGGWKQKLLLTLATLHSPKILFLDEPSTGLDPNSRRDLWKLIMELRKQGTTIVLTTHYMEEAERLCDRIALINHGQLVGLDTPQNLITQLMQENSLLIKCHALDIVKAEQLPEIKRVVQENDWYRVFSDNSQQATIELFGLAGEEGWVIEDFRFDKGTLDDLFVQLATAKGVDAE